MSRGAGKIVMVYADKLGEALIDDMILEMIPFLEMKDQHNNRGPGTPSIHHPS